jgi:hypothetical protein
VHHHYHTHRRLVSGLSASFALALTATLSAQSTASKPAEEITTMQKFEVKDVPD